MIVRLYDAEARRYVRYETAAVEIQAPVLQIITDGGWPVIIQPKEELSEAQEEASGPRPTVGG